MWLIGITTCTSNEQSWEGGGGNVPTDTLKETTVPVKVPITKAPNDSDPENRIVSARIIVIKQNRITNNKVINNIADSEGNIQITDLVPVGHVDFFVIVNELSAWNLDDIDIGDTYFSNNLKQEIITYTGCPVVDATHPIPMFRMYENLLITEEGNTLQNNVSVTLSEVERLYAKVSFSLKCTFEDLPYKDPIEIKSVTIKNMPKEAYLAPKEYTKTETSDFFEEVLPLNTNTYTWTSTDFTSAFLCYIPEYLVSDITRYTYISAVVRLKGRTEPEYEKEYKIVLGNGITSHNNAYMLGNTVTYSDVRISRNTHYSFTGNITSFDIPDEMDMVIKAKILKWEEKPLDQQNIQNYTLEVSQNEFLFRPPLSVVNGVVNVTTDYSDGWSATMAAKQSGVLRTSLDDAVGGTVTKPSSGILKFTFDGNTIQDADTINVTAGSITKKILIKASGTI
jgi:hypothetical protein